jgi:hypothetical protein
MIKRDCKEGGNKSNHPIQTPLLLVMQLVTIFSWRYVMICIFDKVHTLVTRCSFAISYDLSAATFFRNPGSKVYEAQNL